MFYICGELIKYNGLQPYAVAKGCLCGGAIALRVLLAVCVGLWVSQL